MTVLSNFDLTIIGKYFNDFNDFINLIKTNKIYYDILDNYRYNPISLNQKLFKYFNNIETFHYYLPEDKHISHKCNKYIDWTYIDISKLRNIIFDKNSNKYYFDFSNSDKKLKNACLKNNTEYKNLYFKVNKDNYKLLEELTKNNVDFLKFSEIYFDIHDSTISNIDLSNLQVYKINGSIHHCNSLTYLNLKNTLDYNINVRYCPNLKDLNFIINNKNLLYNYYTENGLTSIKLSNDIKIIPHNMFNYCRDLRKIEIHKKCDKGENEIQTSELDNIHSLEYECFKNCGFEELEFKNISKCERLVFGGCEKLKSITLLGSYASLVNTFIYCTSLTNIVIPEHVRTLRNTFESCKNLSKITLPTALTNIEKAFIDCSNLEEINLAKCVNLNEIQKYAFHGCRNLSKVILSDTIKTLDLCAFGDCYNLNNINLESVDKIGNNTFCNCTSLNTIILNCINIGSLAFTDCSNLETIFITSDKVIFSNYSFRNCIKLLNIICDGDVVISKKTFDGCDLDKINITGSNIIYK